MPPRSPSLSPPLPTEEANQQRLLSSPLPHDDDGNRIPSPATAENALIPAKPSNLRANGAPPRTVPPPRVRFDVVEPEDSAPAPENWLDEEDYMTAGHYHPPTSLEERASDINGDEEDESGPGAPLLTSLPAPSVLLAQALSSSSSDDTHDRPRSSLLGSFSNMANSIIGAGIIGQPYALSQAGLISGILLLCLLTLTVDWTIRLIVLNAKLSGANSFQSTVALCFGRPGLVAISLAQWAFAFGGMVAFCVIVGDTIPHVLVAVWPGLKEWPVLWLLTERKAVIVVFVCGVSYPLALYRDIALVYFPPLPPHPPLSLPLLKSPNRTRHPTNAPRSQLSKASTFALLSMLLILMTILVRGPSQPPSLRGPISEPILHLPGLFPAIGIISFAFVCHHNSLLIYGSLRTPTLDRFATVTHASTLVSMLACLAMALAGYLSFGSKTQGNILNNFPADDTMVNFARLAFALNMLATLPLEAFVCRDVMTEFFFPRQAYHPGRHIAFTSLLVLSAVGVAMLTCDLGIVFELVGATSACALAYILPPACFLRLARKRRSGWEGWAAAACVGFGVVVMVGSVGLSVAKVLRGEGAGGAARSCGVG